MLQMHCNSLHGTTNGELCAADRVLLDYAMERMDKCPFFFDKPTCLKCPVHCYRPDRREEIRKIMRYSGPRMMLRHPVLAVLHVLDGFREIKK